MSVLFDDPNDQEFDNINEDSVEGAMVRYYDSNSRDRNSKLGKAIRKVDILNNKLRRGEISKEEFIKQYEAIDSNFDIKKHEFITPQHSSELINNRGRSSEESKDSRQSKDELKPIENIYSQDNMNDINKKKVNRYLDIMASTDNYNDYKEAHKNLSNLLNVDNKSTFKLFDDNIVAAIKPGKEDTQKDSNTKLYHTSDTENIDKLNPQYRSKDGISYYPNKRIYLGKDEIYKRYSPDASKPEDYKPDGKTHAYEVENPSKYKILGDNEMQGSNARYIETDYKVPVKKFKESGGVMSILFDDLNEQEFQEALNQMYENESESKAINLFEQSFEDRLESNRKLISEDTEYFLLEEEMKRSQLPDSVFGVPEQRKYPLDSEKHVRSAIKLFNYVDPKYEAQLASKIKKKMKQYNITDINVGEANRFSKYYHPSKKAVNEGWLVLDFNNKWTLSDNFEEYEKYYDPEKLNESYYTKKDIILTELGEFLTESSDKIKYIEKDSKIVKMPKVCPKCGSKMGIFIKGEPVCLCTNKDCNYYAGTVCFDQKEAAKKFNESTVLSESDNEETKDKVKGKPSPLSSTSVKSALEAAANIPDPKKRSAKIRDIMSSTVGKLSAKIKYIFGNLKLYDSEYSYDGYIREEFPKYLDMMNAKDLYKLKQSIMEHAFTTGRGHKSLKDVLGSNQMSSDRDNYVYNLADKVRRDLSVLLHTIDSKYEKARFDGAKPYEKNLPKEEPKEVEKPRDEEDDNEEEEKEPPKKKRKSYWDVDVSEEEEEELANESAEEILEEKAKIKSDEPDDAGYYVSNLKFKGAKVVVCSRYSEEAEAQIKSIQKSFKNVEKSYSSILESVANEMYNEWSKDHGEKLSRKDFAREVYKSKLQNRVIVYQDDYGYVFEFNYSVNPIIGGRILHINIYTDTDGFVNSYKYELESSVRKY